MSLVGLADALYLTIQHVTGQSVRCTITSGCSEVLSSPYAVVRGVPLALVGAVAYFLVFTFSTLAAFRYKLVDWLLTVLVLLMFLTTLWLLYLQAFVIRHLPSNWHPAAALMSPPSVSAFGSGRRRRG